MVKYFILKMFRVYARTTPIQGLQTLGIGIAGGTGNGLITGLRPVYHFFQMMQMRAIDRLHFPIFQLVMLTDPISYLGRSSNGLPQLEGLRTNAVLAARPKGAVTEAHVWRQS